jgi:two-component system, OmpR family, sensor kinase
MTLTNRLTLFYLLTLGVVLAAFAGSAYGLMRTILFRQLSERSTGTLDTLVAAAEIESGGLDWEPESRKPLLKGDLQEPIWAVFNGAGRRIDGTKDRDHPLDEYAVAESDMEQSRLEVSWAGQPWWVIRRTIHYPQPEAASGKPRPKKTLYPTLVFVTAWPVAPVLDTLRTLLWCVAGGSALIWLAAAGAGRWLSRRALAPVTRMAHAVRGITVDDLGERLPVPNPRDELHELAASFNGLLTRLQESFERQNRFTGEASHQLRTPLSVMLGQIEVALRRERDPEEYRQILGTAHAQAERLRGIVEALLFLARADAEAGLPNAEPLELSNWLTQHLEVWEAHPRRADLCIENRTLEPLWVTAHPVLLEQSVDNLIENACKYSAAGTPVLLTLSRDGAHATLSIEDRGCGISEDDLKHVFEPFFRSSEARRRGIGGLGLGLAVTARTLAAFGGRVDVTSQPGQGSKFSIHLPLAETPSTGEGSDPAQMCETGKGGEDTELPHTAVQTLNR